MGNKKAETRLLYIIFDSKNNIYVFKYLSKVENYTSISKSTLSKHFNKYKDHYDNGTYKVYRTFNVDLKGYYKNNFR